VGDRASARKSFDIRPTVSMFGKERQCSQGLDCRNSSSSLSLLSPATSAKSVTDMDRAIDFHVGKLGFELGFRERGGSSALLLYPQARTRWMLGLFRVDTIVRRYADQLRVSP
jgi:hypothetical protein